MVSNLSCCRFFVFLVTGRFRVDNAMNFIIKKDQKVRVMHVLVYSRLVHVLGLRLGSCRTNFLCAGRKRL
jgi:hypothetical protein